MKTGGARKISGTHFMGKIVVIHPSPFFHSPWIFFRDS